MHRAGHVPRLGVTERPLPRGTGALPRAPGLAQVALALTPGHPVRDVPQQGLAELAHRLRAEPELAVGAALEVARVAQRLLQLLQGAGIDRGPVTQLAGQLVEVEVVHPGAAVRLGELLGERVEVGEVLEYAGPVAEAQPLLAVEAFRPTPVLTGAEGLQVAVELGQRLHQLGAAERLGREGVQLVALLLGHRVAHPLGGGRPLGEGVQQLLDVAGVLGEEVAVLVHELVANCSANCRCPRRAGAPRAAR